MAIVKVKYTRDPIKIKEHLRYIVHRRGRDGERMTRELFDAFESTDKTRAYELIDATKHPLFFKIIINFDAKKEDKYKDLDLQHITRKTVREMQRLIRRDSPFVAVMHDDHTPLRHIHAIGMVQGKIANADFQKLKNLWKIATAEAREQRRSRDYVQERQHTRFLAHAQVMYQSFPARQRTSKTPYRRTKPLQLQQGCHHCGFGQLTGIPSRWNYCPSCHRPLSQEASLELELNQQL
jgi:hypothetical protein